MRGVLFSEAVRFCFTVTAPSAFYTVGTFTISALYAVGTFTISALCTAETFTPSAFYASGTIAPCFFNTLYSASIGRASTSTPVRAPSAAIAPAA